MKAIFFAIIYAAAEADQRWQIEREDHHAARMDGIISIVSITCALFAILFGD